MPCVSLQRKFPKFQEESSDLETLLLELGFLCEKDDAMQMIFYTGKEKDEESGLYYHGARYYACWLGRWTAADPIGIGDGLNVYMYVHGNPVKLQDPSGGASTNSVDEGTVLPTFDDVEVIEEGDVLPTFENIEVKGEGTYLPGDETDRLTENSTFEERQAFANRQGYKIVDPNPEDEWWYDDGEHCQWMLSERGKLVPLQDDLSDSNNIFLENVEISSGSQESVGDGFDTFVNVSSKTTQVGLDVGKKAFDNVVGDINKLGATALDNPSLNSDATKKVQQAFLEHTKAAETTAKFMNRANVALSIGLGAIEAGEYAYQGKPWHVALSVLTTGASIAAGVFVISNPVLSLSLGGVIVVSALVTIGLTFLQTRIESLFDKRGVK